MVVVDVRRAEGVTRKTSSLKKKKKKTSSLRRGSISKSKRPRKEGRGRHEEDFFDLFTQEEEEEEVAVVFNASQKEVIMFNGELKDMRKLSSNDEAFCLSWETLIEIINIIRSKKTPTPQTYRHWDEYAISFYLKMCTCFGVDYQHLEDTPEKGLLTETQPLPYDLEEYLEQTSVGFIMKTLPWPWHKEEKHMEYKGGYKQVFQPAAEGMSFDEYKSEVGREFIWGPVTKIFEGAFDFGCYSSETERSLIPSHLYMLLKKAGESMCLNKDLKDLELAEEKICFFMTYFHSHLPRNFRYKREIAVGCFAGLYDPLVEPRYCLDTYTHYRYITLLMCGWDPRTRLTIQEMVNIMNIIHSRKTPTFWDLSCEEISFYCKLCSCFGIEYHRLEDASENDVCLMNMRRKEPPASNE